MARYRPASSSLPVFLHLSLLYIWLCLTVALLVWFITLCCAARCAFKKLPASHPARAMPANAVLVTPRSSTYQLLPMSPNRIQVTQSTIPSTSRLSTQTLPSPASNKPKAVRAAAVSPTAFPTWGHAGRSREYMPGQIGLHHTMYSWNNTPDWSSSIPRDAGHARMSPHYNMVNPLAAHTLTRPSAPRQENYTRGYSAHFPSLPHGSSMSGYVADDSPPPYHTVVSGP
ncbi:hypothetical protein E2C01_072434 [Portunus trituberculatus]|uniref:Uncharacterized protein n=1 Tax=Portunus trituberculatus TaxID=210409 RepID=A0A5B7I753_PORTR|nr:hypothetical protein [Portunus trituberculatus]